MNTEHNATESEFFPCRHCGGDLNETDDCDRCVAAAEAEEAAEAATEDAADYRREQSRGAWYNVGRHSDL